jgi:protocatechuate 3,4-dioxygenase beta subunit
MQRTMMNDAENLTRRAWLTRSLAAATAIASGIRDLDALEILKPQLHDLTPGDVCQLTCAQTLGPCYYDTRNVRQDITEGKPGLPALLGFLIVNADTCQPVTNATIDIWHTDANGVYSAPLSTFCNGTDATIRQQTFCRGIQPTDASGWAHFRTIYPGWYSGRATHIHATIRVGTSAMVTTQFYFPDAVNLQIYRNHPAYSHRPNPNTSNTTDNIIGGGSGTRVTPYLFNSKLMALRSLVALKVVAIRTTATACSA